MSDETVPQSPAEEPASSPPPEGFAAGINDLGQQERLVGVGAALIVADWFLFELLLAEYSFATLTLLLAAVTLFAMWVHRQGTGGSWPVPYEWSLRVLGYSVGLMGLLELLADIRFGILDNTTDILGGLVLYAGAFLMFYGSRGLKDSD